MTHFTTESLIVFIKSKYTFIYFQLLYVTSEFQSLLLISWKIKFYPKFQIHCWNGIVFYPISLILTYSLGTGIFIYSLSLTTHYNEKPTCLKYHLPLYSPASLHPLTYINACLFVYLTNLSWVLTINKEQM